MKQTLIKITDDHYVVVDHSEIKFGDWFLTDDKRIEQSAPDWNAREWHRKITHSTQPFELSSENGLSGMGFSKVRPLNIFEVKELIGKVDVEKKAINSWEGCDGCDANDELFFINGYQKGYNQALEDNKDKKYTEEDMIKCWKYASIDKHQIFGDQIGEHYLSFIQSLQPKTEWEVTFDEQDKLRLV